MDCDEPGSPPMFGIIVDVNMREHAMQELSPEFYVNPADVMARFLRSANPSPELTPKLDDEDCDMATLLRSEQMSPVPDYAADFPDDAVIHQDFPDEAISAIVSVLKSATTSATAQGTCAASPSATISLPSQAFTQSSEVVAPRPVYALPLGELRVPQQYTAPTYVPYPPAAFPGAPTYAFPSAPVPQQGHAQSQFMDVPQPVLNAHVGITLEELRQRATEYRARHPSAELDKAFLQSFAGRLSSRGELLDDYRCYVVGCGQRNKRRDHILVHVGSHVEHRPWACQHCGMKFLRKNECKRHESSHEGRKPYSCEICAPFQERSFVRQDLLKRHLRVSHGVHGTARKKSANKGEDQDYWP
ncbi:hypothetical protein BD310DRAFT_807712 [Dichomitus squalens]|uniref:C2H2-type domain-containing protein n=1 Tax=Dichomitus squalens TaxID=114155 RepID=A0A4Q9Q9V2_9APHY|nr:hypothetical protein BD310DRAFT_807712 [Dichomitus squalens]